LGGVAFGTDKDGEPCLYQAMVRYD
jgi:hypothetical protein